MVAFCAWFPIFLARALMRFAASFGSKVGFPFFALDEAESGGELLTTFRLDGGGIADEGWNCDDPPSRISVKPRHCFGSNPRWPPCSLGSAIGQPKST